MFLLQDGTVRNSSNSEFFFSISNDLDFEVFHKNQIYYGNIKEKLKENSLLSNLSLPVLKKLVEDSVKVFKTQIVFRGGEHSGSVNEQGNSKDIIPPTATNRPLSWTEMQSKTLVLSVKLKLKLGILSVELEFEIPRIPGKFTNCLLEMKKKQVALERQVTNLKKSLDETICILQLHSQLKIKVPKPDDLEDLCNDDILDMLNGLNNGNFIDQIPSIADSNSHESQTAILESNADTEPTTTDIASSIANGPGSSDSKSQNLASSIEKKEIISVTDTVHQEEHAIKATQQNIEDHKPPVERSIADQPSTSLTSSPITLPVASNNESSHISEMEKRKREREAQLLKSKQAVKKKKKLF